MVPEIELNSHHGGYVYFNSHFPESHDLMGDHMRPTSTIGKYNPEERENLLNRFRKKRAERCYNRKVGPHCEFAVTPLFPAGFML